MDIAIAGAGVGGLTAALLLSAGGHRVTVYESQSRVGGRLAFESEGEYRIDQGPTIVLLPQMLLSILEEGGLSPSRIPLIECDPLYDVHYADGIVLRKYRSAERQAEELERQFPGEGEGFRRFMRDVGKSFSQGKKQLLERPFLRSRDFFTAGNLTLLARMKAYRSARAVAATYFRSEKLIDAYSLQTLYIGGAPFASPGLYALLPYAEHAFGIWYVKGGYAALAPVLEEELRRRGVGIETIARVERVLTERGQCRGISVNGRTRTCDALVYNGDFPSMSDILPEPAPSRAYRPSSGCVLIYLGVEKRWPERTAHQFFLPPSLQRGMKQLFREGRIPDEPSFYVFNPVAIDDTAAPPGHSVLYMLIPVPPLGDVDWKQGTPPLVEHVLAEAERRGFPGLRAAIRWMKVRTPEDGAADGLYRGGSFGIAPTLGQSALFRPQFKPYPINGLYAVGASVHPGGGIPIVMQGAKLLADHIGPAARLQEVEEAIR